MVGPKDFAADRSLAFNIEREKFKFRSLLAVLSDVKTYFFGFIQGAAVLSVSVVGSFLPTFIKGFNFSTGRFLEIQKLKEGDPV